MALIKTLQRMDGTVLRTYKNKLNGQIIRDGGFYLIITIFSKSCYTEKCSVFFLNQNV